MTDASSLPVPAYVVLGMIGLGARSGYEVKRDVDRSIRFFWTISQAQIYPSLQRLERDGLISGRDDPAGDRPRRVYEITPSGREILRAWVLESDPIPFELRDIGMLKLFFAADVDRRDGANLVEALRKRSQERVATLTGIRAAARKLSLHGNAYPLLTLEMGIAYHEAMADVCERFATRLDR